MVGGPARGEATATVLAALPRDTWSVLPHAGWRRGSSTYVGHVVVGPAGVFVDRGQGAGRARSRCATECSATTAAREPPPSPTPPTPPAPWPGSCRSYPATLVRGGALLRARASGCRSPPAPSSSARPPASSRPIVSAPPYSRPTRSGACRSSSSSPCTRRSRSAIVPATRTPAPAAVGADRPSSPAGGLRSTRAAQVEPGTRGSRRPRPWARTRSPNSSNSLAGQSSVASPRTRSISPGSCSRVVGVLAMNASTVSQTPPCSRRKSWWK